MADIEKELNDIKNAVYGKEVRGAIHDGIKKINEEVEDATDLSESAKHQVENIQQQVNQLVVEGDSSVEAAQARVDAEGKSFPTLKARLDEKETQFSSQLAQSVNGINVELAWGLKGEVDESDKLQERINTLPDNSTLVFPNKRFIFKNITLRDKKNIRLVGYFTEIINDDNSKNIINLYNCENIVIEGFNVECTWDVYKSYTEGQFIYAENVKGLTIRDNTIKRGGISVLGGESLYVDHNEITDSIKLNQYPIIARNVIGTTISNNTIVNCGVDGIKISLPLNSENVGKETLITGNYITGCEKDCIDVFAGGFQCVISNNFLYDSEKGVHAKAWGGAEADYSSVENYSHQVIVTGNQIHNMRHQCVFIGSNDVLIEGNLLTESNSGVYIMGSDVSSVKNIMISDNIIKNIAGVGIETEEYTEELIISNNLLESIGGYGMFLRSNGVSITNSILVDVGARGIQISSTILDKNKVILAGVQVMNKNKSVTDIGIRVGDNAQVGSMVSGCFVDGILNPFVDDSGKVKSFNNSWDEIPEPRSEIIQSERALQEGGVQKITVSTKARIKKITAYGVVQNTTKTSYGVFTESGSSSVYGIGDTGNFTSTPSYPIAFADSLANRTWGRIQNLQVGSFDVEWIKEGSGASGTARMTYVVEFY